MACVVAHTRLQWQSVAGGSCGIWPHGNLERGWRSIVVFELIAAQRLPWRGCSSGPWSARIHFELVALCSTSQSVKGPWHSVLSSESGSGSDVGTKECAGGEECVGERKLGAQRRAMYVRRMEDATGKGKCFWAQGRAMRATQSYQAHTSAARLRRTYLGDYSQT
jgi:hypothetical protein